jgi:hypothetical protein
MNTMSIVTPPLKTIMFVLLSYVPVLIAFVQGIHLYKHDIVFKDAYSMHLYVPLIRGLFLLYQL